MCNLTRQEKREVINLIDFIDATVTNYMWPDWKINDDTQVITIEFFPKKMGHYKMWIITLTFEKVKQINSVIKTGQFKRVDIVKKIERDYSIFKDYRD